MEEAMKHGGIKLSSKPDPDDLSEGICSNCGCNCQAVAVDESFGDDFGTVEDYNIGSDCCGVEVLPLPEEN
jgi:hypothetical protein